VKKFLRCDVVGAEAVVLHDGCAAKYFDGDQAKTGLTVVGHCSEARARWIVRAVRCHVETGGLHCHVGSDRRCQPGCGAAPAQYGRREEGNQTGPNTGELEGQAGQATAQGSRRATTKIGMANLVYNIKRLIFLRKIAIA
jgi:hypothetical protein